MEIENIKFDQNDQPLCPKCGEPIKKLWLMLTIPTKKGRLFGIRCGYCGRRILAHEDKPRKLHI